MAFGPHWEWRGFGKPAAGLRSRIFGLEPKFSDPQELLDEYLWAPGCRVNLKLREGSLKFKRLEAKTERLELWNEPPEENHAFPLEREVVGALLADLGGDPGRAAPVESRSELLALLHAVLPEAKVIGVRKKRWQMELKPARTTVELAEIYLPESVTSVGLEHEDAARVKEAIDVLELPGTLRVMSYMDAIERWARGGKVGED
jgi:hypothetical protein